MIIKLIISPFIAILNGVINLIPTLSSATSASADLVRIILKGLNFFPAETWSLALGSIVFWSSLHLIMGLISFVVGLIPVVNVLLGG